VADRENASQRSDERARQLAARRQAQHEVELLALEWNRILLQKHIDEALDPKTDARLRRDLRNDVLNRGVGRVKEREGDEDAKKQKGVGVQEFLEALATVSAIQGAIERTPPPEHDRTERDIGGSGTDIEAERFLSDLSGDVEVDDT
jgi:tRNA A37 N6-isopentenylltransferase MiaA